MEYDLILEQGRGFAVWNRAVTDRMGVRVVWPERMPDRNEMVVFSTPTLVLKRRMGYAEAQRMKERCEKAWGKLGYGLNYERLP